MKTENLNKGCLQGDSVEREDYAGALAPILGRQGNEAVQAACLKGYLKGIT